MRYLKLFSLIFVGAFCVVAAFNVVLDPYQVLGSPRIARVNTHQIPIDERIMKPVQASARQPETVYFGSSRVQEGLDPEDLPELNAYNFGFPSALMIEIEAYGHHVMVDTPARHLVIGLDFFAFNDSVPPYNGFHLAILGRHARIRALPELLLSIRSTIDARKTWLKSRNEPISQWRPNGFREVPSAVVPDPKSGVLGDVGLLSHWPAFYPSLKADDRSLLAFEGLLAEAHRHGVKVLAFVTPQHAALSAAMGPAGLQPLYENWLRRLAQICADQAAVCWDFGGYNRLTTVPIEHSSPIYIGGGQHFRPWIGKVIVRSLFAGRAVVPDFGVPLEPGTVEAYIAEQTKRLAAWKENNSGDWADTLAATH